MHLPNFLLTALSATLVASLALPLPKPDSVRITSGTPALDSASDGNTVDKRQDTGPTGRTDWTFDRSGAAAVDRRQGPGTGWIDWNSVRDGNTGVNHKRQNPGQAVEAGKRVTSESPTCSHGCVNSKEGAYDLDGTSWDNGSAWDN